MKLKIKNAKSFNTYVVVAKDNSVSESYDIVNESTGNVEEVTTEVVEEVQEDEGKKKKKRKEKKVTELDE